MFEIINDIDRDIEEIDVLNNYVNYVEKIYFNIFTLKCQNLSKIIIK